MFINDEKILVLRYNEKYIPHCIERHIDIEKQLGYVWYAKCGAKVAKKTIDNIIKYNATLMLYSPQNVYKAKILEYTYEKPKVGYPEYYNDGVFPIEKVAIYLKLNQIEIIAENVIDNLVVMSTGKRVADIFYHSSCSNVYARYLELNNSELRTARSCSFNKNGICDNTYSLYYGDICDKALKCNNYS